jgi:selenophosphate synthase
MADFNFSEDSSISVEIQPTKKTGGGWEESSAADKAKQVFKEVSDAARHQVFQTIYTVAWETSHLIKALNETEGQLPPETVQIQFGLTFTGEAQVSVVKGSAAANFNVTISWTKPNGQG